MRAVKLKYGMTEVDRSVGGQTEKNLHEKASAKTGLFNFLY